MARRRGWKRVGSKGRFRYVDARGRQIQREAPLERIEALRIPPAWRDVWISPRAGAKLQATGVDPAGRRQYLYHPEFRARQEQAKFDKLVSFAEKLPDLRAAMAEHMEQEPLTFEWTAALAVRLINLGWFRVGDERYARQFRTFGITTLRKSHVRVRGSRIAFRFRGKHRVWVRTGLVDAELADAMRKLLAAVALAERDVPETETEAKRTIAAVMRTVGERLGNTPAVARASYVSPAVIEQYLDGRTIDDFRPRHLRIVGARDMGLDLEELALLSLLRSWRIRRAGQAA